MPDWRLWLEMADESIKAAREVQQKHPRSAVSRSYYAAYQASTAFLLYRNQIPPDDREAWSHAETPGMLNQHLVGVGIAQGVANNRTHSLKKLYKSRLDADYTSSVEITKIKAQEGCRDAGSIIKVIEDALK